MQKVLKRNPPPIIFDSFGSSYRIFAEVKDKPIGVYKPRLQVMRDENNIPLIDLGVPPTRIMDFEHKLFGDRFILR